MVPQTTSRPLRKPRFKVSLAPRAPGVLLTSRATIIATIIAAPSSCTHLTCGLPSEPRGEAKVETMAGTLSGMQKQSEAAKQEHAEDLRIQPSDGAGWASHDRPSSRAQQYLKTPARLSSCPPDVEPGPS